MPLPTAADIALATAFVDGPYRLTCCPIWFANHRAESIRHLSVAEMQKRQDREWVELTKRIRAALAKSAEHDRRCLALPADLAA